MRERDSYMKTGWYGRVGPEARQDYRNGYYERDYVTRLGTIRLRIARTRGKNFIPKGLKKFQRRAEDVAILIREAFLRASQRARWAESWRHSRVRRSAHRRYPSSLAIWTMRFGNFIRRR